jgi:hypothetical protein
MLLGPVPKLIDCAFTRTALTFDSMEQAPENPSSRTKVHELQSGPVFPLNPEKLDRQSLFPQKLNFWNSLTTHMIGENEEKMKEAPGVPALSSRSREQLATGSQQATNPAKEQQNIHC